MLELAPGFPFLSSGLIDQIVIAGGGYPYLTVNAYNIWAIVPGDTGMSLANAGVWVCDAVLPDVERCGAGVAQFGALPTVVIGAVLLLATIGLILWVVARHPDRLTILVALAVLALAFFAVPTRVHERYGFPFFAIGAILFAVSPRWRIAYVVLSVATFANMYVVLTTLYPDNPSISDWLGIGGFLRSEVGVVAAAVAHTARLRLGAPPAALQRPRAAGRRARGRLARSRAARRPSRSDEPAPRPVADPVPGTVAAASGAAWPLPRVPVSRARPPWVVPRPPAAALPLAGATAAAAVAMPTWTERRSFSEVGIIGWLRDRLHDVPTRADRSASLEGEGGGRFDRLDIWILLVLFVATLGMRTFRLAEPAQMHFDEVYHARTATEFLQSWRYGIDHDIYEWTHPHVAKYVMAGGIALWGEDDVSATSELGVPVLAAAHEPRREDALQDGRAGERVHVATGERDPHLRPALAGARRDVRCARGRRAGGRPVGRATHRRRRRRQLSSVDLIALDLATDAAIEAGAIDRPELTPLATVDHPITHLLVTDDGATILAASDDASSRRWTPSRARSSAASRSTASPASPPAGTGAVHRRRPRGRDRRRGPRGDARRPARRRGVRLRSRA